MREIKEDIGELRSEAEMRGIKTKMPLPLLMIFSKKMLEDADAPLFLTVFIRNR
jgi:hypothetical protein